MLIRRKSINPKFLDWPTRGTPGSKWVTFMLPDADETDVKTCKIVDGGLHRALAQNMRMDVSIYWQCVKKGSLKNEK